MASGSDSYHAHSRLALPVQIKYNAGFRPGHLLYTFLFDLITQAIRPATMHSIRKQPSLALNPVFHSSGRLDGGGVKGLSN